MKRIIYFFLTILLGTSLSAQQHLTFIDIPIDGPLDKFSRELSLRGYVPEGEVTENILKFQTDINGQPIDLLVVASEDREHVYRVVFLPQPKMSWRWLRKEYYYYKKLLTEAYGAPTKYVEAFLAPYNTRKKLRRRQIHAIASGRAQWSTFFSAKNNNREEIGSLMVQIVPSGSLARVIVVYEDAANAALYAPELTDTEN